MISENKRAGKMLLFGFLPVVFVLALYCIFPSIKPGNINNECCYDLDALKKTDTNLLLRAGVIYFNPSISNLTAIAVDSSDNIYAGSKSGIDILDQNGRRIGGFSVNGSIRCLAVSAGGEILAGMKDHVEIYEKTGFKKAVWDRPDIKTEIASIAVSLNYVYVSDYVNRIIWHYSRTGELLGRIGDKDNDQRLSGFVVPSAFFDVAVSRDGSLWVASPGNHRIEHFSEQGKFISSWGRYGLGAQGFCGCCNPSNIAIMPDGSFVTSEKHIVRIKLYDTEGRFKGIISGQEDWHKKAVGLDLAVDSRGRILVLDPQADVIRIYTAETDKS